MTAPGGGWSGLRRVFSLPLARRARSDVDEELRFHLEERVEELVARGLSREEAEREARTRFGDVSRISEECATLDSAGERRRSSC